MKPQVNTDKQNLEEVQATKDKGQKTNDYLWLIGCFIVTLVAAFLRFWQLELKPLHHDEGVNGYFLKTLFSEGIYKYDPSNYHGPTLYYISLAFAKVFGLNTLSIRASVAIFGVFIVILTFFLRKYIGTIGSLAAALMLALSPGMVFISRYFIHEIFFVFCSLGVVLGVLFFIEGRKAGVFAAAWTALLLLTCLLPPAMNLSGLIGEQNTTLVLILRISFFAVEAVLTFFIMKFLLNWNEGRFVYLLLASASLALFFATKETAFITIGTMLIACLCVWVWRKTYAGVFGKIKDDSCEPVELNWRTFRARLSEGNDFLLLLIAVLFVFVYVSVLFFSSFFTYPKGVLGAFEAYAFWTKTGTGDHTQNGMLGFVKWLWKIESPILFLSAIGTLIAFIKGRHRFAMFAGLWAFGL
ncbi:MAG TPA: phospholipid carrier-dependent glycosyltransferase, partial [Pyrinomonadaceae bacterium]